MDTALLAHAGHKRHTVFHVKFNISGVFQRLAAEAKPAPGGYHAKQRVCQLIAAGPLKPCNSQNFTPCEAES